MEKDNQHRAANRNGRLPRSVYPLLCLVLTPIIAALGVETLASIRHANGIAAIHSSGGYAVLDRTPEWPQGWRGTIRSALGIKQTPRVAAVRLAGCEFTDADLKRVSAIRGIRMLDLRDTRITDRGLSHLRGMSDLKLLVLTGTQVSDSGAAHLARLRQLEVLILEETDITDGGLRQLAPLTNLMWLDLSNTKVSGKGLLALSPHCRRLEALVLQQVDLHGREMAEVQTAFQQARIFCGNNRAPFFNFSYL